MKAKPKTENAPRIYTVAEASRVLQVQEAKVRAAILEGDLPAARIGRIYRILEADLMRFFESKLVVARKVF